MQIDDGILSRRRWASLGAIALVLLAGVVVLAITSAPDAPKQPRRAVAFATPAWRIGDTARVSIALDASDAAGPATTHGSPCRMEAGATGKITEIGGPLSDPRGYVELATPRCAGWVSIHRIETAQ